VNSGAKSNWVVVATAPTLVEADVIVSYLRAHGIEALVPDSVSLGVASLSALPSGFRVTVLQRDAAEAKRLLSSLKNRDRSPV